MTRSAAASVHQRLLNMARADGKRFNDVLQHYALERWLYRLSVSPHAVRFILKGALMLTVWRVPITRPTRDIDLLAQASNDLDVIKTMIADVCSTPVKDDGLLFDVDSVTTERIAEDAEYAGVRATFRGRLGNARVPMQIDLGFSDVVTPEPISIEYPTLLDMPAPRLRAYNRETAIAEKFEAMVKLGDLNSRMKDFFDVWTLATEQRFDGGLLAEAVRRTFEARGTPLSLDAACFGQDFAKAEAKQVQWRAFIRRSDLPQAPPEFEVVWASIMAFLRPTADARHADELAGQAWAPGGPWMRG